MGKSFSKNNTKKSDNQKKQNISKDNKYPNNKANDNIKENKYSSKENKNYNGKINLRNNLENNKQKIDIDINSKIINYEFLRNIAIDSHSYGLDDLMIVFKSIDDILYFIYTNKENYIISYNLIENKKINVIKNASDSRITNFKHYLNKDKNQDLMISASLLNNLKLWRINDWECLLKIKNINDGGDLRSACFLILKNNIYILTSNIFASEPIKVFNLNGVKIKEINNSRDDVNYIDIYYDNNSSKPYILAGNCGFVKSYDYNDNKVYHIYNDYDGGNHYSIRIKNENNLIKLIESSGDGNIRIWNFHTGELLNKIYIIDESLFGICLWDNYLFIGCGDNTIKILDIEKSKIIDNIIGHNRMVLVLAKIDIPNYGECLISQENGELTKLWKIKFNI